MPPTHSLAVLCATLACGGSVFAQVPVYQLEDGFEAGALQAHWNVEHGATDRANVSLVTAPVRTGTHAVRLVNRYADPAPANERTEMTAAGRDAEGRRRGNLQLDQEYWVGFSFYLKDWAPDPSGYDIVNQFHAVPHNGDFKNCVAGRNLVTIRAEGGELRLHVITRPHPGPAQGGATADRVWSEPLVSDTWYDWVYHLRPSQGPAGLIEVWRNGEVVFRQTGPNADPLDQCGLPADPVFYLKCGVYNPQWKKRPPPVAVREIFYDEVRLGHVEGGYTGGYAGVAPAGPRPAAR